MKIRIQSINQPGKSNYGKHNLNYTHLSSGCHIFLKAYFQMLQHEGQHVPVL